MPDQFLSLGDWMNAHPQWRVLSLGGEPFITEEIALVDLDRLGWVYPVKLPDWLLQSEAMMHQLKTMFSKDRMVEINDWERSSNLVQ